MIKYLFLFLLLGHGLVHALGFLKAFELFEISQLTQFISKPVGLVWGLATVLFVTSMTLYYLKDAQWALWAIIAVVISQTLIGMTWQDAKFGTIVNLIILMAAMAFYHNGRIF